MEQGAIGLPTYLVAPLRLLESGRWWGRGGAETNNQRAKHGAHASTIIKTQLQGLTVEFTIGEDITLAKEPTKFELHPCHHGTTTDKTTKGQAGRQAG